MSASEPQLSTRTAFVRTVVRHAPVAASWRSAFERIDDSEPRSPSVFLGGRPIVLREWQGYVGEEPHALGRRPNDRRAGKKLPSAGGVDGHPAKPVLSVDA